MTSGCVPVHEVQSLQVVPELESLQVDEQCCVVGQKEQEGSTLALVDTACTRCMHGEFWREKFEKECLAKHELKVEFLKPERDFTSAFGHKKRGVQV